MWENEFTSNEMEVRKCCWHVGIDLFWKRHRNWNKFQKVVTTVFKQYETGLREGRINAEVISNSWIWPFVYLCAWVQVSLCTFNCAWLTQDLHTALVACGLNPMEQEVIDMTNEVARSVEHSSFIMIMFMHSKLASLVNLRRMIRNDFENQISAERQPSVIQSDAHFS